MYKSLVYPLVQNPAKTKDPRGLGYSDAIGCPYFSSAAVPANGFWKTRPIHRARA